MGTNIFTVLAVVYILLSINDYTEGRRKTICESNKGTLRCIRKDRVLSISKATYGRRNLLTCNQNGNITKRWCGRANNVLEKIKTMCNSKRKCEIFPSNIVLPDPCPGRAAYLTVNFLCVKETTPVQTPRCGIQQINPRPTEQCTLFKLFYYSCNVVPHSWPWAVQMRLFDADTNTFIHACAAVLISESLALTASHCFISSDNLKDWKVIGGRHLKDVNETNTQYRNIIKIVKFPNDGDNILDKDLAIIKFDQPMKMNTYVSPICLPTKEPVEGDKCVVAGWGFERFSSDPKTVALKDNANPIVIKDECDGRKVLEGRFTPYMLCAGFQTGKTDSCWKDIGSPLMNKIGDAWYLQGLATFGVDCEKPSLPDVYANVFKFVSWITDQMTKL